MKYFSLSFCVMWFLFLTISDFGFFSLSGLLLSTYAFIEEIYFDNKKNKDNDKFKDTIDSER